jgi:isopentenyl-diphosphate delta-isomerase
VCSVVDYIFIIRADVDLEINPNEVKAVQYLSMDELKEKFKNPEDWKFTPWFKLISENLLFNWWQNLDNLEQFKEIDTIYRL